MITASQFSLTIMALANTGMVLAAGPCDLNDAHYDNLRSDFLNVYPALISDADLNQVYAQSDDNGAAFINGQTNMGIRMDESSINYWLDYHFFIGASIKPPTSISVEQ